jgi:probable rRNA maturation factor
MKVQTVLAEDGGDIPRRSLALLARRVLRGENGDLHLTIVFAGDALLRRLNRRFRRIDRTTDVLSFRLPPLDGIIPELGEVYISLTQARKQARRYRHTLTCELRRLVVHGVLHLLGHDHQTMRERRRMQALETAYLRRSAR